MSRRARAAARRRAPGHLAHVIYYAAQHAAPLPLRALARGQVCRVVALLDQNRLRLVALLGALLGAPVPGGQLHVAARGLARVGVAPAGGGLRAGADRRVVRRRLQRRLRGRGRVAVRDGLSQVQFCVDPPR